MLMFFFIHMFPSEVDQLYLKGYINVLHCYFRYNETWMRQKQILA